MPKFSNPTVFRQRASTGGPVYVWFKEGEGWVLGGSSGGGGSGGGGGGVGVGSNSTNLPTSTSSSATNSPTKTKVQIRKKRNLYTGLESYFPPITYSISCVAQDIIGGQLETNYNVQVVFSVDLKDKDTEELIYRVFTLNTLEVTGPIKGVGAYISEEAGIPTLNYFVKYGTSTDLDELLQEEGAAQSYFYLTKPNLESFDQSPALIKIEGDYTLSGIKVEEFKVSRVDGLADNLSQSFAGQICTLTIRDRYNLLAEEQFVGRPKVVFADEPPLEE